MVANTKTAEKRADWRESPTAWFAAFDSAMNRGDISAAAKAQRELSRLGVEVTYRPHRKGASRG